MNRINIIYSLLSAIMMSTSCYSQKIDPPKKPNILFIFSDDQSYNTVAATGNKEVFTPNLDKLAQAGVTFSNTFNMGGWNGAVCIASRTMLNSGRSVWRAQNMVNNLDESPRSHESWGRLLSKAGYKTYMSGKWHIRLSANACFDQTKHIRPGMPKQTKEGYNRPLSKSDTLWTPWDTKFGGFWEGGKHWSEEVADDAISFLDDASKTDNPFFMYLAFNAPHDPRQSPKEFVDLYPLDKIAVPESFLPEYPDNELMGSGRKLRDEKLAPFPRTEYSVKVNRQEYYAIISHMDSQIGRIIAHLKKTGQDKNTYIVFTSDHGLACGNHGLIGKQNMYDHSVRVPMFVVGPDLEPGKKVEADIYLQDIMPTTLQIAGVKKPEYVEFQSFLDLAEGRKTASNYDEIYGCYINFQRMIRKDNKKLIVYPKVPKMYLFDLEKDPYEMNNLADLPAYKKLRRELFDDLVQIQKELEDDLVLEYFDE